MFWKRKINAKPKPATVKATTSLAVLLHLGELQIFGHPWTYIIMFSSLLL